MDESAERSRWCSNPDSLSGGLNDALVQELAAAEAEAPPALTAQHAVAASGALAGSVRARHGDVRSARRSRRCREPQISMSAF